MKTQTLSLGSSLHLTSSGLETCPGTLSESCTGHSGGMKTRGRVDRWRCIIMKQRKQNTGYAEAFPGSLSNY